MLIAKWQMLIQWNSIRTIKDLGDSLFSSSDTIYNCISAWAVLVSKEIKNTIKEKTRTCNQFPYNEMKSHHYVIKSIIFVLQCNEAGASMFLLTFWKTKPWGFYI